MVLNEVIPLQSESAIASYEYVDLAQGTGMRAFYPILYHDENSAVKYKLVSQVIPTEMKTQTFSGGEDWDFDLTPFNLPDSIKGEAIAIIPLYNANAADYVNATIQIRKVSGGVETNVSSAVKSFSLGDAAQQAKVLVFLSCTETHFKSGDILRVNVVGEKVGSAGTDYIGADPQDSLTSPFTSVGTQFKLLIPFKIDR